MTVHRVLIVNGVASGRDSETEALRQAGFEVVTVPHGASAKEIARKTECDVAVVDLYPPCLSGMDIVHQLKAAHPRTEIVVVSSNSILDSVVEALNEHVFAFLSRPVLAAALVHIINNAIKQAYLRTECQESMDPIKTGRTKVCGQEAEAQRALAWGVTSSHILVGQSDAMVQVGHLIEMVAPSDMTVLIRGESGTGKDVVARIIHRMSGRQTSGSLIKINCPAVPEQLLESEMFGHERGAFTGAVKQKPGRFEIADGGTLFLDEIGAVSPAVQAKLLDVVEHKQFTRVGGVETRHADVRIVAATNLPLEEMIARGEFRSDLFYRLEQFTIILPPLRDRREDIPPLAQHFLRQYGPKYGRSNLRFPREVMAQLVDYNWPGNVRELEALVERFALSGDLTMVEELLRNSHPTSGAISSNQELRDAEVRTIMSALSATKWNRRRAAEVLGVSYSALRRRISKYNLEKSECTWQAQSGHRAAGLWDGC